jgi:hypothetical protein
MIVRSLYEEADRVVLLQRLEKLTDATPARWGRMNVAQMLRHVAENMRMAIGELPVKPRGPRILKTRIARFVFFRLPIPRGVPTAPELIAMDAAEFAAERARVRLLVNRYSELPRTGLGAEHPLFGLLTREEWACLQYKHADHHLRQFGV